MSRPVKRRRLKKKQNQENDFDRYVRVDSENEQSNNQTEIDSSDKGRDKRAKRRQFTELEKFTSKYASFSKTIETDKFEDGFCPFDRIRPAYLLKKLLNSHNLNDILKMYILITKDPRICPFLLTKTGFLLLRMSIRLRLESEEICKDVAHFVKIVKSSEAVPNAELFMDFMVFCYETGNESLIEEFGNLRIHVVKRYHLYIKHMCLCFNMFLTFIDFKLFFDQFKADKFDHVMYRNDEVKNKDFAHICIQLQNLTVGIDSDEHYPLDYMCLTLIDLLVLFKKFKKAKKYLLQYNEQYPTNLNAVIYLLRFNELYLKDINLFRESYNRLIKLDPSNRTLIYYIDFITVPLECLKVMLSYVDYTKNKEDRKAWRLIYSKLSLIGKSSSGAKDIRRFYNMLYASYWPAYHFTTVSVKINPTNCDYLFHKAFIFNYFQPDRSAKFVAQISFILASAKSNKVEHLKKLTFESIGNLL